MVKLEWRVCRCLCVVIVVDVDVDVDVVVDKEGRRERL